MSSMARLVSLGILTTLIVFLGITFYRVVAPYLLPLFLAGVVAILCRPLFQYFRRRTGGRIRLAAGLTTTTVLAIVLVPLVVGTLLASLQLYVLAQEQLDADTLRGTMQQLRQELQFDRLAEHLDPLVPGKVDPEQLEESLEANLKAMVTAVAQRSLGLARTALGLLGAIVSWIVSLAIFALALYYFLADGPALREATENLIPVNVDYQRQLAARFDQVVRAVVMATFLSAIVQGVITAAAVGLIGVVVNAPILRHFFIIFLLATLVALIPLAGSWLVWGPVAVWLAWTGHWVAAALLTAFGAVVVGTLDNVVRTYVLHTDAKLHPLLAFVSVLGGLQVMGLWGIFIGPIVACFLHALVQIFNVELQEFSRERFGLPSAEKDASTAATAPAVLAETSERTEPSDVPGSPTPPRGASTAEPSTAPKKEPTTPDSQKSPGSIEQPAAASPQSGDDAEPADPPPPKDGS